MTDALQFRTRHKPFAARPLRRVRRHLLSAPVTLTYLLVLWALGLFSSLVLTVPARVTRAEMSVSASSVANRLWSVVTSGFWAQGIGIYVTVTLVLLLAGVPLERRLGSLRFGIAAGASHILGIAAAAGLVWGARGLMGTWPADLMTHAYMGPSAALFGAAMAATPTISTPWRRRLRVTVLALLLVLALYDGSFPDLVRFGAAVVGLGMGSVLYRRRPRFALPAMSRREARVLVALGVSACAVGPVIAGLSPHAAGPLSVLRFLFTDIQPVDPQTLQTLCGDPAQANECAMMRLQLRAGAGGIFMSILPSFMLLLSADGLRRGRRFAWGSALVVLGAMAVVAGTHIAPVLFPALMGTAQDESTGGLDLTHFRHPLSLVLPLLLPIVLLLVVSGCRRLFAVSAPPGTYRRLALRLLVAGSVLAGLYVVAGLILASGFTPVPGLLQLVADVPDRFLPLGYTLDIPPAFFPQSTSAVLLYEGTGVAFWALTAALILLSFLQPAHSRNAADLNRARTILMAQESSPLSWMTTWPGNTYWFSASGNSFVAFRVSSGIALALGVPVGPTTELRASVEGFSRFCNDNGWTPCFYSVTRDVQEITAGSGWGSVQVALETILPLDSLTFKGKKFQDIRTALNKASKEGVRAEWVNYLKVRKAITNQIHAISEEWIAEKKMPEMGFTLGGIDELKDPEVRCLLAIDEHQVVHAVTSWLPVYRNGAIVGWTLDFMRRRQSGFRTGIEFLIATAALTLKDEGYEIISLSGAPLARAREGPDAAPTLVLDRVLNWLGTSLEPVYGFRSLLAFKAKFGPRYEPLYMVYPDAAALPSIANAITRAYLPETSFGQRIALARRIIHGPPPGPDRIGPQKRRRHRHTGRRNPYPFTEAVRPTVSPPRNMAEHLGRKPPWPVPDK